MVCFGPLFHTLETTPTPEFHATGPPRRVGVPLSSLSQDLATAYRQPLARPPSRSRCPASRALNRCRSQASPHPPRAPLPSPLSSSEAWTRAARRGQGGRGDAVSLARTHSRRCFACREVGCDKDDATRGRDGGGALLRPRSETARCCGYGAEVAAGSASAVRGKRELWRYRGRLGGGLTAEQFADR